MCSIRNNRSHCSVKHLVDSLLQVVSVMALLGLGAPLAAGADLEYVIRIKDHRFDPAELHVPRGTKMRVVLDNEDDISEEFDSHALNREKHVPGKSQVTLFLGPLEPGRYLFEGENNGDGGGAALGVIVVQ